MADFSETTNVKESANTSAARRARFFLGFYFVSILLIVFQKYIYEWFAQLAPSPIYKVVVWAIIAFHVLGLLILLVGSIFAISGKLIQKPLLLWVYFAALHLMLFGTVISFILGVDCFLTALEKVFRLIAEMPGYRGGFIAYYLSVIGINITGINISIGFTILFAVALVRIFMQGKKMVKINVLIAFILLAGSVGLAIYRMQIFSPVSYINNELEDLNLVEGIILEKTSNKIKLKTDFGSEYVFDIERSTYFQKQQGNSFELIENEEVKINDRVLIRAKSDVLLSVLIINIEK